MKNAMIFFESKMYSVYLNEQFEQELPESDVRIDRSV